jgi:hypothetical protein
MYISVRQYKMLVEFRSENLREGRKIEKTKLIILASKETATQQKTLGC